MTKTNIIQSSITLREFQQQQLLQQTKYICEVADDQFFADKKEERVFYCIDTYCPSIYIRFVCLIEGEEKEKVFIFSEIAC